VLTLAAGFLFGAVSGTAIVSVAATLGATLAFLVSRYVARPLVLERLGGNERFLQISANVAQKGPLVLYPIPALRSAIRGVASQDNVF
jgi:uncharacterized membrane protein YdjX (TVP38/TMEM64 family)